MPTTPKHPLCVLCKVCLDQLVNSPIGTATFFMWTQAWKGRPERVVPELREKLVPTTMVAWRLWPAAQAINFLMVPSHLRILFLNAVAIIWTTILSTISN
jgi:protein Mpv17